MTSSALAKDYLNKVEKRLKTLPIFMNENDYSDVIREGQEIIELCLKAMLRQVGIEPPKWHDVGGLLIENKEKFPKEVRENVKKIAQVSKELRKERELAFYGDIDFIPSEEYKKEDAEKVIKDIHFVVRMAKKVVK